MKRVEMRAIKCSKAARRRIVAARDCSLIPRCTSIPTRSSDIVQRTYRMRLAAVSAVLLRVSTRARTASSSRSPDAANRDLNALSVAGNSPRSSRACATNASVTAESPGGRP